jgi:F-type H+-transporting ATPase subunit delta
MLGSTTRNTATQLLRRVAARSMSTEAAPAASSSMVTLNFSVPHETIYQNASVYSVIIPGVEGEYGVTGGHVPYVAQLKPGVLQILHEENQAEPEKYFVCGGYSLTHSDSTTVRMIPYIMLCWTVSYCTDSYAWNKEIHYTST